jgi:hypothetical protein
MMVAAAALALLVTLAVPRAPAEVPISDKDSIRLDRIKIGKNDSLRVVTAMPGPSPSPMLVWPPVESAKPSSLPPSVSPPLPSVRLPPPATLVQEADERSDICTRHGLRKVITQGGRSWRCRKPE